MYHGPIQDTSNMAKHYFDYLESAKEQGIGILGGGDAEKEKARLEKSMKLSSPNKIFPVNAGVRWNPSDFAIQVGEDYYINISSGSTTWTDGSIESTANGFLPYFDAVFNCFIYDGKCYSQFKKSRRFPSVNWMMLICGIGEYVRPLSPVLPGGEKPTRWLPLDEPTIQNTLFSVGSSFKFTAKFSGQLICFANDSNNGYWNNKGILNVQVTRVSWPPSNSSYYSELYFPTCDSAVAVYNNYGEFADGKDHHIKCNEKGSGGGWKRENIQ